MSESHSFGVSVVIPAYNVEEHIGAALESVLAQTRPAQEIIVVDDGSTDNTAAVVKGYGERVRYIYQANAGPSAARNAGIKAAGGTWIALLDSDDEWLPEKLERQLDLLQHHRDLMWTVCNLHVDHGQGRERSVSVDGDRVDAILQDEALESFFALANTGCVIAPCAFLIKREVFERVGYFAVGQHYAEDFDMYWRIAYRWPQLGYDHEPLAVYRAARPGSLTAETPSGEIVQALCDTYSRHLALAEEAGFGDQLKPFIAERAGLWTRGLYRQKEFKLARKLLTQFGHLLPAGYARTMRLLTRLPRFTIMFGLRLIKFMKYDR